MTNRLASFLVVIIFLHGRQLVTSRTITYMIYLSELLLFFIGFVFEGLLHGDQ